MIGMTVCSGIGAPEHAAPWIDWRYQSEIEPFPSAVLKARFPDAVNLGDMTKFKEWPNADVDVLCGGTPCQSFSVAGLRKGLDDPRGNLMLTYLAIAERYKPRWIVWENVPGVLSSNGGRDFGSFLGGLGKLGYGFAYRVLDVQYGRTLRFPFAIPQRRRRVFVVGHLGDWRRAAEVLLEPASLSRNPPPRREAGQNAAPCLSARTQGGGGLGTDFDLDGGLVANTLRGEGFDASEDGTGRTNLVPEVAGCMASSGGRAVPGNSVQDADQGFLIPVANSGDVSYALCASAQQSLDAETETLIAFDAVAIQERAVSENPEAGPDGSGVNAEGAAYTLEARNKVQAVAFDMRGREGGAMPEGPHDTANLRASSGGSSRSYVAEPWAVRRLTPTECERLMGFPDGWTQIPWRGKPAELCPDGPRYKALGNSWGVNAGEYVFDRIRAVDAMARSAA